MPGTWATGGEMVKEERRAQIRPSPSPQRPPWDTGLHIANGS
jgi:hypothetical protein